MRKSRRSKKRKTTSTQMVCRCCGESFLRLSQHWNFSDKCKQFYKDFSSNHTTDVNDEMNSVINSTSFNTNRKSSSSSRMNKEGCKSTESSSNNNVQFNSSDFYPGLLNASENNSRHDNNVNHLNFDLCNSTDKNMKDIHNDQLGMNTKDVTADIVDFELHDPSEPLEITDHIQQDIHGTSIIDHSNNIFTSNSNNCTTNEFDPDWNSDFLYHNTAGDNSHHSTRQDNIDASNDTAQNCINTTNRFDYTKISDHMYRLNKDAHFTDSELSSLRLYQILDKANAPLSLYSELQNYIDSIIP